jgi:hypothetical protein
MIYGTASVPVSDVPARVLDFVVGLEGARLGKPHNKIVPREATRKTSPVQFGLRLAEATRSSP